MLTVFLILYWTVMYYFIRRTLNKHGDHDNRSAFLVGVSLSCLIWPVWMVGGIVKTVKENSGRG